MRIVFSRFVSLRECMCAFWRNDIPDHRIIMTIVVSFSVRLRMYAWLDCTCHLLLAFIGKILALTTGSNTNKRQRFLFFELCFCKWVLAYSKTFAIHSTIYLIKLAYHIENRLTINSLAVQPLRWNDSASKQLEAVMLNDFTIAPPTTCDCSTIKYIAELIVTLLTIYSHTKRSFLTTFRHPIMDKQSVTSSDTASLSGNFIDIALDLISTVLLMVSWPRNSNKKLVAMHRRNILYRHHITTYHRTTRIIST